MSGNLQYRFQQHETPPPPGSWERIAARLDEEYQVAETDLSVRMMDSVTPVPSSVWDRINLELDKNEKHQVPELVPVIAPAERTVAEKKPARVVAFNLRRVAAVAIIFLAIAALFYLMNDASPEFQQVVKTVPTRNQAGVVPSVPQVALNDPGTPRLSARKRAASGTARVAGASAQSDAADTGTEYEAPVDENISYANVKNTEQVEEAPISIPTQPIRDRDGNIIMDEKLVSAPDVNYVTVTAPNGEQTRISKKFMGALGYMNSGMAKDDYIGMMLQEGSNWKWLFQEWRNKLLKQPSFIPTATNFLDIMELKEMLHENF